MPKGKVIDVRPKKRKHNQKAEECRTASTSEEPGRIPPQSVHGTMDRVRYNRMKNRGHIEKHLLDIPISSRLQRYIFFGCIFICTLAVTWGWGLHRYNHWRRNNLVRNPLDLPKIITHDVLSDSLFWGSYRPGMYFGLKNRSPNPLLVGLIWTTQNPVNPKFRHLCDPNDGVLSYSWIEHDGRNFGVQQIVDVDHVITISFVKQSAGNSDGGDWSVRITAVSRNQTTTAVPLSVIVYFYYFGSGKDYYFQPMVDNDVAVGLKGSTPVLGEHEILFHTSKNALQTSSLMAHIPKEDAVMDTLFTGLGLRRDTNMFVLMGRSQKDDKSLRPNAWFHEVTVYPPALNPHLQVSNVEQVVMELEFTHVGRKGGGVVGKLFDDQLNAFSKHFHERFSARFPVDMSRFTERQVNLSKIVVSNLLGGIGYFHGRSLIQSVHTGPEPVEGWAASLYTATPSRSNFPRGFLWDEGFHGLILAQWDPQLAMESVGHWLDLMNGVGWIPREQILGTEARSRVPDQFIVQHDTVANPPTLILVIEMLIDNLPQFSADETAAFRRWSSLVLPRLHSWYQWFNETQSAQTPLAYRWRGRDPKAIHQLNPLTLSSGLDDYPRASHPSELERHLDLRCWMALFARVVARLASLVAQYAQTEIGPLRIQKLESARSMAARYGRYADLLADISNLDQLHWSEEAGQYADFGMHTDSVRLQFPDANSRQPPLTDEPVKRVRVVEKPPTLQLVTSSFGYVNLFPLLLRLIPPSSSRLPRMLADLAGPDVWTDFGLRSLSANSPFYQKPNTDDDPPYWRGAIWINMNFLAARSLQFYATHPRTPSDTAAEASRLYKKLSENLVRTVLSELERTGFLWEQYNDITGNGQRAHPFSGWTALVSLLMG